MKRVGVRLALVALTLSLIAPLALTTLRPANAADSPAWLGQATLYSLFVRSFRDSNSDGVGDLQGVIDGLDYLQSLGVDTIWLLPVFESASYHGYDVIDYFTVERDYGTNDDLLRLIKAVHERGMKIILDYVMNHTSTEHPYFKAALGNPASEYAEYFEWTNEAHTAFRSFANLGSMPTLNFESEKVYRMALEVALYWMDPNQDGDFSDGIDGWRCDVALEVPHAYWKAMRAEMQALNPQAIMLAELFTKDAQEMRRYLLGDEFHAAFDFPSAFILSGGFESNNDGLLSGRGDVALLGTILRAQRNLYCKTCVIVHFINNHDTNRVASDVEGDMARLRLAAVWLMTAPGVPILYYGEEIGMRGVKAGGPRYYDEYRREPLDWYALEAGAGMTTWFTPADRFNRPTDGISIAEQDGAADSLLTLYRDLGKLRRTSAFRDGSVDTPKLPLALFMSRHWDASELVVTLVNFTLDPQAFPMEAALLVPEKQSFDLNTAAVLFSQGLSESGATRTLAPAGFVVYRLTP